MIPGSNIISEYFNGKKNTNQLNPSHITIYPITPSLVSRANALEKTGKDKMPKLPSQSKGYVYRVGEGDILQINMLDIALEGGGEQSNQQQNGYRVEARGTIVYPYVGEFKVAGQSVSSIRRGLEKKLQQYLIEPQVTVSVLQFQAKKVYVTGEVLKPGVQAITNVPLHVIDALNYAGGITEQAQWNNVQLSRKGKKYIIPLQALMEKGDLSYNYLLQDGDILHVPKNEKDKVFIMGEVYTPKAIDLGRYGKTLTEALGYVGGLNENKANPTGVFIIRNPHSGVYSQTLSRTQIAEVYQLNMQDASALALASKMPLKAGDVIYVTAAPVARWNRIISNLSAGDINTLKNIAK